MLRFGRLQVFVGTTPVTGAAGTLTTPPLPPPTVPPVVPPVPPVPPVVPPMLVPVPIKGMLVVAPAPLWAMLSIADTGPAVVGWNSTVMVQVLSGAGAGATVPQVSPTTVKAVLPVTVASVTTKSALPLFLTVIVRCGAWAIVVDIKPKDTKVVDTAATGQGHCQHRSNQHLKDLLAHYGGCPA